MRSLSTLAMFGLAVVCGATVNAAPPTPTTSTARLDVPNPALLATQDGYEVIELPPPHEGDSVAIAVGTSGKVVGYVRQPSGSTALAAAWTNGQATGVAPCQNSIAQALSPSEVAAGTCGTSSGFIGTTGMGGLVFGAGPDNKFVGAYLVGGEFHAWVTTNAPSPTALQHPPGYRSSLAVHIDNNRRSAGYAFAGIGGSGPTRALFWNASGVVTFLAGRPPTHEARAISINDGGLIVGRVGPGGAPSERAAKWEQSGTTMVELGSLGGRSSASDVNRLGAIVGWSYDADGDLFAVVFKDGGPVNLNTQIHRPLARTHDGLWDVRWEWVLQEAFGINDSGYICGVGTKAGKTRGFLLKPKSSGLVTIGAADVKKLVAATHPTRALSSEKENPLRLK